MFRRDHRPKRKKPLVERLGIAALPRHTMLLPYSAGLLDWFRGQLDTSIQCAAGEEFSDRDLEPYLIRQRGSTKVLVEVTGYPLSHDADLVEVMRLADATTLHPTERLIGLSPRSSEELTQGAIDALREQEGESRSYGTHPCRNGDFVWGIDFKQGELVVLVEIPFSLGSGVDLEVDLRRALA